MAVFTSLDRFAVQSFLDDYDLPPLESFEGIAAGVSNTNYLLTFPDRKAILTILEKGESVKDAQFFIDLMRHCQSNDLNCPIVHARKDGTAITTIHQKPAFILSFIDGRQPNLLNSALCHEAGKILARFHSVTASFNQTRLNPLQPSMWRQRYIDPVRQQIAEDVLARVDHQLNQIDTDKSNHLPRGLCFLDYFPDNVFFKGDQFEGLIDFYYAAEDIYVYDLMIALNAWCFDKPAMTFNSNYACAFLKGYQQERPLSDQEYQVLPQMGQLAATRILCSRLYDKIMLEKTGNKMHDPLEYDRILRFHLNIKHPDDYST